MTNDELTAHVAAQLYVQNAVDWSRLDLGATEELAKLCWRSAEAFVAMKDKAFEPAYVKDDAPRLSNTTWPKAPNPPVLAPGTVR